MVGLSSKAAWYGLRDLSTERPSAKGDWFSVCVCGCEWVWWDGLTFRVHRTVDNGWPAEIVAAAIAGTVVAALVADSLVGLGTIECRAVAGAAGIEPEPELARLQRPQRQLN